MYAYVSMHVCMYVCMYVCIVKYNVDNIQRQRLSSSSLQHLQRGSRVHSDGRKGIGGAGQEVVQRHTAAADVHRGVAVCSAV